MYTLLFDRRHINLEYENQCLIIRSPETPPRSIPLSYIRKIICLHSVQLTTALLGQLWERGIDFINLNQRSSERSFALYPKQQQQVKRRCLQYSFQQNDALSLPIAKAICTHRILGNLRTLKLSQNHHLSIHLYKKKDDLQRCITKEQLRGVEGACQRLIFDFWRSLLPSDLNFQSRKRRPALDPVNALLSLTYTLAMQEAIRQCTAHGLDSQLGVYHSILSGRHSLACDLLEPIRPYCEQWVMTSFLEETFTAKDFTKGSPCLLIKPARERYYQAIAEQLKPWRRSLMASARWLCKHIDQHSERNPYEH
ncbi:CRISPR-associated endonuclease Cas1 [Pseudomonas sp. F1_0610]|uniref:CRISPR-associated endonuclease Cas1 n=1 Tax=Pseudomonas sp. F1_0610 TaxID=3114284 RepID=UPI0039C3C6E0